MTPPYYVHARFNASLSLSQIYLFWVCQMVDPICFTLGMILNPLEVVPGASAPLYPPSYVTALIGLVFFKQS